MATIIGEKGEKNFIRQEGSAAPEAEGFDQDALAKGLRNFQ